MSESTEWEEEQTLVEGNVISGEFTVSIHDNAIHRLESLLKLPGIRKIELDKVPKVTFGNVDTPFDEAIHSIQSLWPSIVAQMIPGQYQIQSNCNNKTLIVSNSTTECYPLMFNFDKIDSKPTVTKQTIENSTFYIVPGVSSFIYRGLNNFEMNVLTNDLIVTLLTMSAAGSCKKPNFRVLSVNYDTLTTSTCSLKYFFDEKLCQTPLSTETVGQCCDRIMRRLLSIDRSMMIIPSVAFHSLKFLALRMHSSIIRVNRCLLIFDSNQREFFMDFDLMVKEGSEFKFLIIRKDLRIASDIAHVMDLFIKFLFEFKHVIF